MSIFNDEIQIINDIENGIHDVIKQTIQKHGIVILEYNRTEQLSKKGEDSKGDKIKPPYSKPYARLRIRKGLQANHVDAKFTGRLHASMTIEAREDDFIIRTNVEYDKYLIAKYGKDILGVQDEFLQEFANDYLIPALKNMTNDKLAKS